MGESPETVAVIIDEFQQLIAEEGEVAEKQLRATVWERLRIELGAPLTAGVVDDALATIVRQEHPAYARRCGTDWRTRSSARGAGTCRRG